MVIRNAALKDAPRLQQIYAYYVEQTAISFEYEAPSVKEFECRMAQIIGRYPYLVAEENGVIIGYIYAHPFIERKAYQYSCEVTIYLDKDARGNGTGKRLYEALEAELTKTEITNLYVCVGVTEQPDEYLNNNSAEFHRHIGFRTVGEFYHCGYKFGKWYSMIWMEKILKPTEN